MSRSDSRFIEEQVKAFVAERTGLVSAGQLDSKSSLFASGLLDSMGFLELVVFAEERFGVRLSDAGDVTMQTLDTVGDVATVVCSAQRPRTVSRASR